MKILQAFKNSYQVFSLIWKRTPLLTTCWLLIPVLIGVLTYPLYGQRKQLINLTVETLGTDFHVRSFLVAAAPVLIFIFLTTFGQFLLTTINQVLAVTLKDRGTILIREQIWNKAFRLDYELVERNQTQDMIQRANQFIGEQLLYLASSQMESVRILLTILSMLAVILAVNPWVALLVSLVAAPALWLKIRTEIAVKSLNRDATNDGRKAEYLNGILTKKEFAKELRVFGFANHLLKQFEELLVAVLVKRGSLRRREIKMGAVIGGCNILVFGMSLYILARNFHGADSVGAATVVIWAVLGVQQTLMQLVAPVQYFVTSALGAEELLEFLRLHESQESVSIQPVDADFGIETIEFKHVYFRYPNSERMILNDVNMKITKGEKIAIVGENGSGKSTMIKLLIGIYEPTEGQILINGRDLRDYPKETLYKKMSVVMQNFIKFPLTFRENFEIGNLRSSSGVQTERMNEFLENLKFREVIESSPNGWETHLGGFGEATYELSGGQWSLLAMARSTIKKTDLVILDELSSALDPMAEVEVFRHYQKLFKEETVVLISHRLGWARFSDRILMMKQGSLIEMGTHNELISKSSEYAKMYQIQAEWYAT